jgi:hypothetical protein
MRPRRSRRASEKKSYDSGRGLDAEGSGPWAGLRSRRKWIGRVKQLRNVVMPGLDSGRASEKSNHTRAKRRKRNADSKDR